MPVYIHIWIGTNTWTDTSRFRWKCSRNDAGEKDTRRRMCKGLFCACCFVRWLASSMPPQRGRPRSSVPSSRSPELAGACDVVCTGLSAADVGAMLTRPSNRAVLWGNLSSLLRVNEGGGRVEGGGFAIFLPVASLAGWTTLSRPDQNKRRAKKKDGDPLARPGLASDKIARFGE